MPAGDLSASRTPRAPTPSAVSRAILWGWLVAGVLDIADAMIFQWAIGNSPVRVLHYIASGVVGRAAYDGGAATAALGLALHFVVALGATVAYVVASLRLPALIRRPVVWGTIHGLAVNAFMRSAVLPLAGFQVGRAALTLPYANLIFAHVFCVGLPIALVARRVLGPAAARP